MISPTAKGTDYSLYLGDCLEILPQLPKGSIHLLCTDPPYGLNYNENDLAAQWEKVFQGKENGNARPILGDSEQEANDNFRIMLRLAKPLLGRGCCCCCCCCGGGGVKPLFARWSLIIDEEIGFNHAVVWDKGGLGMGIHFRRSYEFVLIGQNGSPSYCWNGGHNQSNLIRIPKIIPSEAQHPTVKPVALMKWCIELFTNKGDVILDPFAGSSSTGVAALECGRKYIGIEKDERFFDLSERRIRAAKEQERLSL